MHKMFNIITTPKKITNFKYTLYPQATALLPPI